jgi:hypothetical protein
VERKQLALCIAKRAHLQMPGWGKSCSLACCKPCRQCLVAGNDLQQCPAEHHQCEHQRQPTLLLWRQPVSGQGGIGIAGFLNVQHQLGCFSRLILLCFLLGCCMATSMPEFEACLPLCLCSCLLRTPLLQLGVAEHQPPTQPDRPLQHPAHRQLRQVPAAGSASSCSVFCLPVPCIGRPAKARLL